MKAGNYKRDMTGDTLSANLIHGNSLQLTSFMKIDVYDVISENFPDFTFIINMTGRIIREYKSLSTEMFPYEVSERDLKDIFPAEIAEQILLCIEEIFRSNQLVNIEYSFPVNDVNRIFQARLIPSSANEVVLIGKDITDVKRAQEAVFQSELRFRSVWENSIDGMCLIDMNGNIAAANKAFSRLTALTSDQYIGLPFVSVYSDIDEHDAKRIVKEFKENFSLRNITPFSELSAKFKSGKYIFLEVSSVFIEPSLTEVPEGEVFLLSIFRDITERKNSEQELRESEEKYRTLIDTSPDPIINLTTDGNILMVNKRFRDTFNVPGDKKLRGEKILDFIIQSDAGKLMQKIDDVSEKKVVFNSEFTFRKHDGNFFPAEINMSLIPGNNGSNPTIAAIIRDVTERKRAEEELRKSEKLAAIGKMAAYISHEIKTPLASIKMNIDMITRDPEITTDKHKSLSIIQREIKRLNKLLRNILQYSKNDYLLFANINVSDLINSICEFAEAMLNDKKIQLINKIRDVKITGDYQKLHSVFLHLIENSIEAIESNGIIEIYADEDNINNIVNIYIRDNGCGIENPENIFEPFVTTKNTGTGLGLAIAGKIISQHNGTLSLYSSKPGDTIFCITLYDQGIKP